MLRRLYLFVLTLALVFASAAPAAWAKEKPQAEIGELPANAPGAAVPARENEKERGPALVVPHDVPIVLPTAKEAIPPLPPSYVTKQIGGWLELSYPPSAGERVATIIAEADSVKTQLATALGQDVLTHVTVRVAPTVSDMAKLAPADAPPPEYASGVAYHGLHFVLLSMLAPHGAEAVNLDEVFRHELAHVALEDAVQGKHVPVWFNEGLAIWLSGELSMARTKTLWSATLSGTLIPLSDLDRSFPRENFEVSIAYAESADFLKYLLRKSDRVRFASMVSRVREGQTFERAIAESYGADLRRLEFEWRGDLEHRFSIIPVLTGGGLIWVLVVGLIVAAYVRRRRRSKAILARWAEEEAIEDALLAKKLEAERALIAAAAEAHEMPASVAKAQQASSAQVKVEHHGRWHTLH